jgi:hypothetical protein
MFSVALPVYWGSDRCRGYRARQALPFGLLGIVMLLFQGVDFVAARVFTFPRLILSMKSAVRFCVEIALHFLRQSVSCGMMFHMSGSR